MKTKPPRRGRGHRKPVADPVSGADDNDNLSERAHRSIADLIVNQGLNGMIVESRLAGELGISRTPLREALQRLEGEGLVGKAGSRSFAVRQLGPEEVVHSLHVRELLEMKAVAAAAARIPMEKIVAIRKETEERWTEKTDREVLWRLDEDFHDLILDHCDNEVLGTLVREQRTAGWLAKMRVKRPIAAERIRSAKTEHLAILDALAAGDGRRAARAMQAHIRSLIKFEIDSLR